MKSIEVQFYEFCRANDIVIGNNPSQSTVEKLKLVMKNQNKTFNIDNYGEAYSEGRLEARRIEKAIETEKKLLPIFNMGTIRNNFNSLSGRDYRMAIINSHIHNFSVAQDEIWDLGSGLVKKETSWAIMGGIASGLAGGAAGLAVATDVQRRNAQIRADNAELMQKRARYIALCAPQLGTMEEEKKRLQSLIKKAENSLVEDSQNDLYFKKLNINEPSIFLFSDNRYVIFADFSKEDIIIYGDIKAEIEGVISAEIYDGDKKIATVDASLPLFNARNGFNEKRFIDNKVNYDEITYSEKYAKTIICSGVFKHEFSNKPVVKFVNKKLWAIEKIQNNTNNENIKYAQSDDILSYVRENNDYIASINILKKDKLLKQANSFIKSATESNNNTTKLDYYNNAINILQTISDWKNSDELFKECKLKSNEISNAIKQERKIANSKKRKKFILVSVIVIVAVITTIALLMVIKSNKYNSAIDDISNKNYQSAYATFSELKDYKDSELRAKEAKAKLDIGIAAQANVNETIFLGMYEQDGNTSNGAEPIEWIILDKTDTKALVMSKYSLHISQFAPDMYEFITWENSYIREWLNEEFYNTAFNEYEQSYIKLSEISEGNKLYEIYDTFKPGREHDISKYAHLNKTTTDKIFLLSLDEAKKYRFEKCELTPIVESNRSEISEYKKFEHDWLCRSVEVYYWTHQTGPTIESPYTVTYSIPTTDKNPYPTAKRNILPAMWIDISSIN